MLKIRLQRTGRKHEPTFRVVLTDSKNGPKSGKFIEILGNYDARRNDETQLKKERIQHWIAQGAQPSDTVHNLLITHDVIAGQKRNVLPQKTPIKKESEEVAEATTPATAETPAPEAEAPIEIEEAAPAEEAEQTDAPVEETAPVVAEEVKEEEGVSVVEEGASEEAPEENKEA